MKKEERAKMQAAKAAAKKAAEENVKARKKFGEKNEWGYYEGSKGGEVCAFLLKSKKPVTLEEFKKEDWVTSRHTQVFKEMPDRGATVRKSDGAISIDPKKAVPPPAPPKKEKGEAKPKAKPKAKKKAAAAKKKK